MTARLVDRSIIEAVVSRTMELSSVPAPTGEEGERAQRVADWWRGDGWDSVHIDSAGNVLGRVPAGGGPALIMAAHLDTVYGPEVQHGAVEINGQLLGPSVADNTVGVAALSAVAGLLPRDLGADVWIVGTVAEEGLGNLRGMRHALEEPPGRVDAVIAVEGNYLGRVVHRGVGSVRLRVALDGPGGHAWERADSPSAIHEAAAMITEVLAAPTVQAPGCTLNVGRVSGGEAVNARARAAWFDVDLRSDDPLSLEALEHEVRQRLTPIRENVKVAVAEIGRRNAGGLDVSHPLVVFACRALEDAGLEARLGAASTDANAAYALGMPAVALGVSTGGGEHSGEEWLDLAPIGVGLSVLATTITSYLGREGEV